MIGAPPPFFTRLRDRRRLPFCRLMLYLWANGLIKLQLSKLRGEVKRHIFETIFLLVIEEVGREDVGGQEGCLYIESWRGSL